MCKQEYTKCRNHKCDGIARTLALQPCVNTPHCEIEYIRVPGSRQSTEIYCPNCMATTSKERRTKYRSTWTANSRKAKTERANAQVGRTNAGEISAHAGVEEMPESSTMGASGGTIGHGILPDSGNPSSIPEGALETEWSDEPYVTPEEEYILRTNLNHRRMERVSGSDEPMVDTTTNEEDSLTDAVPDVTFGPQQDNTGASTPTFIAGLPQNNPTGTTIGFFPTVPMHPPSSPQIPIDPVLLHMDAVNFNNGRDPTIRNPRDAYVWPELPHDSKKQQESKKGN